MPFVWHFYQTLNGQLVKINMTYSVSVMITNCALKVSQLVILLEFNPVLNHFIFCAELPWVKESGLTCLCDCFCSVSSPMALAAVKPSSTSPVSSICRERLAWKTQTPAKQSAYNSCKTDSLLPSLLLRRLRAARTLAEVPFKVWIWWLTSCAIT